MMTFEVPMFLTGDLEPAGFCGCGEYVGPHHVCPPEPTRRCQWCGKPADLFDIDGAWCSFQHRDYDRASESTIRRRWEQ